MAMKLRCRPSALLGVTDFWVAFCVDRALFTFGTAVENEMDEAEARLPKNAKEVAHRRARQRVLDEYLGVDPAEQPERFRTVNG